MRRWLLLIMMVVLSLGALPVTRPTTSDQIRSLLFDRRDRGGNSFPHGVDPPLWGTTRYLLEGESHTRMLALLDELLTQDVAQTMPDARQRALLQHELWQVFDWTTKNDLVSPTARIALRKKLAIAIRRVALTKHQIAALPSGLVPAGGEDAPPNFADEREGWVCLGSPVLMPLAEVHLEGFGGRSVFGVFIRHPEGRQAALAYLARLAAAPYPPATQPSDCGFFAPDAAPQFPVGTRLGLLRRMMLIDREGLLVCSPIVQTIQVREFLKIEPRSQPGHVRMREFVLDRGRYLVGEKDALCAVGPDDCDVAPGIMSHDIDWFESHEGNNPGPYSPPRPILESCRPCHMDSGVLSMNSYTRAFARRPARNPGLEEMSLEREISITADWKRQQASWGMLRGYWEATEK